MSPQEAREKAARFDQLARELRRLRGESESDTSDAAEANDSVAFWVPGRIEVLGKHTDYGGGRSLLCAAERGICIVARKSEPPFGSRIRIRDVSWRDTAEFAVAPDVAPSPGHWSNYPITVARRVALDFPGELYGADVVFTSDLPHAAGVSSSSALVVATFLVLSAINQLPLRPEYLQYISSCEDLGGYLGAVENGLSFKGFRGTTGVGTFGGSEDQTAILCARAASLVQYSFCPVTFERAVALPDGYAFVIATSGVLAEKTGAALEQYNGVSRRLSVGLDHWRRATGRSDASLGAALMAFPGLRDRIRSVLSETNDAEFSAQSLVARFDQFSTETQDIIPAASDALARDDLRSFGDLVAMSQRGAENSLANQIPETITLVRQARELGAVAASAFGAGFGGSVWAMVRVSSVESFRQSWAAAYSAAFPEHTARSEFFSTRAGPPAMQL